MGKFSNVALPSRRLLVLCHSLLDQRSTALTKDTYPESPLVSVVGENNTEKIKITDFRTIIATAALHCLCKCSDHLKKQRAGRAFVFFCVHHSGVGEICRQQSCEGVCRREGGSGVVRMPEVGIGCLSPARTPEPQCGVPVHILKHHDCLLLARFCLPPLPLLLSLLLPLFLFLFLSRGSYIT